MLNDPRPTLEEAAENIRRNLAAMQAGMPTAEELAAIVRLMNARR